MNTLTPENHFNGRNGYAKQRRQKSHHMVRGPPILGLGRHADLQLRALGFANGVLAGGGFTQNIDDQGVAVPSEKRLSGDAHRLACIHGTIIRCAGSVHSLKAVSSKDNGFFKVL